MSASTHGTTPYYYVPAESRHPVMAAAGLFFVILGAGQWINGHECGTVGFRGVRHIADQIDPEIMAILMAHVEFADDWVS